ncbi:hypothetical protein [Metabacillus idriensis]|uniref:hypothetical protein n=1 Tax=Metabacillus idriensis TaxID=324768 RepID=UPI001749CBD5|nr:hypothetical protein [Metabacillus idriensis]
MIKYPGFLTPIIIGIAVSFLVIKTINNKKQSIKASFIVYPEKNMITNKVILISDNKQADLHNIELNDERELIRIARKQYDQYKNLNNNLIYHQEN